jgi:hypothetical protein
MKGSRERRRMETKMKEYKDSGETYKMVLCDRFKANVGIS